MKDRRQLILSGRPTPPQEQYRSNRIRPVMWATLAGILVLFLTLQAFRSVAGGAMEDSANQTVPGVVAVDAIGIQGQKWLDKDGNGRKDAGEEGISDWGIYLVGDGIVSDTLTDAGGHYQFTGLPAGKYVLAEEGRPGWIQSYPLSITHDVDFDGVNSIDGIDFGNLEYDNNGFKGMKFNDLNGDGRKDEGEPGIPGWTIMITDLLGITQTSITDIEGHYSFIGLPAGLYTITEVLQDGWTQTAPDLGGGINYYVQSLPGMIEGLDFGNHWLEPGVITGAKFEDLNGNRRRDNDEPGLESWQIILEGSGIRRQTNTNLSGIYSFTNIPAGTYTITEEMREGWTQTLPVSGFYQIKFDPAGTVAGLDFGNQKSIDSGIHGLKFADRNGNGRRDEGEPGLAGWQVNISGTITGGDEYSATTTTDADGRYWFLGLPSGRYKLWETAQAGWQQTFPPFDKYEIVYVPGQPIQGVDFGNYRPDPGSIHGLKFEDRNGNSRRDAGELGLPGWQINLRGESVAGIGISRTITTDIDGNYWFTDVLPGLYLIVEVQQAGWLQTFPRSGFHTAAIEPGGRIDGLDFGNYEPPPNSVRGVKFHDLNGNGRRDAGEPGLPGWQIVLGSSSGLDVQKTDADGRYAFEDLPPDDYYLFEVQQDGWRQTTSCSSVGSTSGVLDKSEPPQCIFTWGKFLSFNTIADFGNWQPGPGQIQGVKWHDANGNGRRDADEKVLSGWTINLIGERVKDQTTTDENGRYVFPSLEPGNYFIFESPQAGWIQTFPMNNAGHSLFLGQGDRIVGVDFGNWDPAPGKIQGIKFEDNNGNGRQDAGELGLSGWTIVLQGLTSKQQMVTDGQGAYTFENLRPGPYLLWEINQNGWRPTTPETGYHVVKLESGDVVQAVFGNWQPAPGTIQGIKWDDLDGDGQKDPGEPGLPGVTIYADINSNATRLFTKTAEGGHYQFNNLPPGRHIIREVVPDGYQQIFPAKGEHVVDLAAGTAVNGINFGNWQPEPGAIHGSMWHDLNGNGLRDEQEPAVALGKVLIISEDNDSWATQTDEDGNYWFMDLLPGKYRIVQELPSGWQQTYPETRAHLVALAAGQEVHGIDFGRWRPLTGSIHGQKFEDLNGNGLKDPNEPGLANWVVFMIDELGQVRRTVTDGRGNYWFEDVLPGMVKVGEILNYGWRQTAPKGGGHLLAVAPGQAITGVDFGNQQGTRDYCKLPSDIVFTESEIAIERLEIAHEGLALHGAVGGFAADLTEDGLFEIKVEGLPAGTAGSAANGPESFDIMGDNPIAIPVGSRVVVPLGIHYPISFTEGYPGPALFAVTVTDLASGESFGCRSRVWPAREDVSISPLLKGLIEPLLTGQTLVNFVYEALGTVLIHTTPADLLAPAAFNDLGETVTISYTFSAASEGPGNGPPDILLNGLPVGNVVQGVITVPVGISGTLGVAVSFGDQLPKGPSDILLELDYGADGVTDVFTSAAIAPPQSRLLYLPAILRQ